MFGVTRARFYTILAALAGSAFFLLLKLPLPLLLGPLSGCLVAALAHVPLQAMGTLGTIFRTVLGVAIGTTVTPDFLHELPRHGPTLMLVPVYVLMIALVGYPLLRRGMGFDHPTAFYSAMPGGLQDMLIFGEEAGGDVRAMSLIHATRILVIVTVVPFALAWFTGVDLTRPPGAPAASLPAVEIALMVLAGLAGWKGAERLRLFGASILGPLILSAALTLAGLIHSRPPVEMIMAAQFFIGIAVGAKYTGITGRELRVDVVAGLLFAAVLGVLSLAIIAVIMTFSPASKLDILLAFLPGGQAEMALLAIVTGADVAFVVSHHLLRIFVVILSAPYAARHFDR